LNSIIATKELTKTYHKGTVEVHALRGITFSVELGELIAIVGRSGSGKSTLLNIIGGLDDASSGALTVEGVDLAQMRRAELARYRRTSVGMIFQSFNLIPSYSAVENVALPMAFAGTPRTVRLQKAADMMALVGLASRQHHLPSELSGGEAQRVAIARALINQPRILLADEPTGNLDSRTAEEILELLQNLNRQRQITIIMVTHDEKGAGGIAHRLVRLLDGQIVEQENLRRPS